MKITQIYKTPTTFKSQRKSGLTYNDFLEFNKEFEITNQLPLILNEENCIGEGRSNKVYKLPHTDKFLLKTYKGLTPHNIHQYQKELTPTPDIFADINVGQAIARMGQYILILIKQAGEQHSIPFMKRNNIEQSDITKYLSDIEKLANISLESYKNFTNEIKELTQNNCYIDYFNSNNLLINDNEINIVDIVRIRRLKQRFFMFPSQESLIKVLVDENILPIVLNKIPKEENILLGKNIRTIIEKITEAMKSSNLPQNTILTNILDFISDTLHNGKNKQFKTALKNCIKV